MGKEMLSTTMQQTMSSLEIAKLAGKEHKNVIADIRKVLSEVEILVADFSATRLVRGKEEVY